MPAIVTRTLSCGMPLIVEHIPGVKSAAVSWLLPCGCAHDPEPLQGLAPMWAELLLRGAGTLNSRQHADAFDRLGASRSASAGTFTFGVGTTLLGSRLHEALPLLVDMVLAPRFDEDSIEPARDLCLQAIESLKDEPQERCALAARERHLPPPLNRSGLGTEAGLNAISRDDVASHWKRLARPRGSIFAAAGAVDADALASSLDSLLGEWSGATDEIHPDGRAPRGYAHEIDQTNQVQIIVVHDAPPEGPAGSTPLPDDALLEKVVVGVLSGGMSGRLFTEVREKRGLCYSVSAGYRGDREFGNVSAYVGTTPERAQDSLNVLLEQLHHINTPAGRVTPEELQRVVVGMKSGLIFSGESTSARASALASDQRRLGRPRSLDEIARKVDAITLDMVNEYAARRRFGTLTIQTLGPKALTPPV